ncbi:spermidine synthase [Aeromicrobium sp. CTD01-1L150]|uniref:spermidine synthase n=1 Tax=Aeromicrobium sp. CTD01-1L150 TaxID=3341830 RepID=UPI0035BFED13
MAYFEELDWQRTPLGEISLRRRYDLIARTEVYEVRLGEEYLMSSLFTASERALATHGLAMAEGEQLSVVVGGLGLGYTAAEALKDPRVADLSVLETAEPVLDWHRRGLLPEARSLIDDARCTLLHADFFAAVRREPDRQVDAILLDIDHTPDHVLHPSHAAFYTTAGLTSLREHLRSGGVFGLWSDDPPDPAVEELLAQVFIDVRAQVVTFPNPLIDGESACTVYLARRDA